MSIYFDDTREFALHMDRADPLFNGRNDFIIPKASDIPLTYFCGNSLGLQPVHTSAFIDKILADWGNMGVEAFRYGQPSWMGYQYQLSTLLSPIVGALPNEVSVMNSLTVNLHLMLQSFYQPKENRRKILIEAGSFPSDRYAIVSFLEKLGLDAKDILIELQPKEGAISLETADILTAIEHHRDELLMVMLSGVQYYTGQFFDIPAITTAAQKAGALAGWDMAHAVGNVPLQLHDWKVDFAVWCHYKYLNGGPGASGGVFIHKKHFHSNYSTRLAGWWGNASTSRFQMQPDFEPENDINGWHISTPNMLSMAAVEAGLIITHEVGIENIRKKSLVLTGYLEYLLNQPELSNRLQIITPNDPEQRGAQLSIFFKERGADIQAQLKEKGFITDYRSPGVIRIAPAPLYNSFEEVYRLSEIIKDMF